MNVPISAQIECAERELAIREDVYPRWISAGRITQKKANHELLCMKAIVETLREIERKERLV